MAGRWQADLSDDFSLQLFANLFRNDDTLLARLAPLDDGALSLGAARFSGNISALLRLGWLADLLYAGDFGNLLADLPRDRIAHL